MIFRKFKVSDADACIDIWNLSFPDDKEFSKVFFDEIISFADAFVCEYESRVSGFISVFKFMSCCGSKQALCYYIYGVCVHPDFRNRGIMRKMISSVMKLYNGQFILIPRVAGIYEKFGFIYIDNCTEISFNNYKGKFEECYDIRRLDKIYGIYTKKFGFSLKRTDNWWNIIVKTVVNDGYKIIANDGAYAIINDGKILEFAYISDEYKDSLPVGNAVLKLPEVMSYGGDCFEKNYIALMLDWE